MIQNISLIGVKSYTMASSLKSWPILGLCSLVLQYLQRNIIVIDTVKREQIKTYSSLLYIF